MSDFVLILQFCPGETENVVNVMDILTFNIFPHCHQINKHMHTFSFIVNAL